MGTLKGLGVKIIFRCVLLCISEVVVVLEFFLVCPQLTIENVSRMC